MYDLLVIGGGPGGSTCARRAAMMGLDVVLIEKKIHPRQKPCGGALSPRVKEVLDFNISDLVEHEFNAAVIHRPSGQQTVLTREGFRGCLIQREQFDRYLLDKAKEAGVQVIEDTEIIAIEQLRKGIRALSIGDSFKGHLLVGADGVNGISMKQLGIRERWHQEEVGLCISTKLVLNEKEIERITSLNTDSRSAAIELYYGFTDWGYGWIFPKRGELNIGVGCRLDRAKTLRDRWKTFCAVIEEQKEIDLRGCQEVSARVPLGGISRRYIGRRSMLIGDAAGLVSPVSGEGISYAIDSGILAADIAVESVRNRSSTHIIEYDRRLKQGLVKELADLQLIAGILYKSNANIEIICEIVDRDPLMREYLTDVFTRISTYSQLRTKIVKRLLSHHPLKALRLGL